MFSKSVSEWFAKYRIFISKILGIAFLVIFFLSEPAWLDKSYAWRVNLVLQSVGLVLVTICIFGRLWSAIYLCGNKTFNLVTQGPYSIMRNPLYFFSFLGVLGLVLTTGSLILTVLLIGMFVFYYFATIIDEEKTLERHHEGSEELAAYMKNVPRVIPNFSLLSEPELLTISPYGFKRTVLDVMWFMWVYLGLVIIMELHAYNILPVLFKII